jgi:EAL domain-containing protein (putative c-di-GMP-specific phosphodiesterase class I)
MILEPNIRRCRIWKNLPIQTLKLDRSFIENLENDIDNAKICKASISLSHDLGLRFIAQGVEAKE